MSGLLRVLYAEGEPQAAALTRAHFAREAGNFSLEVVGTAAACLTRLREESFDLVLLAHPLSDQSVLDVIRDLRQGRNDIPVLFLANSADESIAGASLRLGASDYVVKRRNYLTQLPHVLERAFQQRQAERTIAQLRAELESTSAALRKRVEEQTTCVEREAAERRMMEQTLGERERLLVESQRIGQVGGWIYDLSGRITWSPEAYRIWGVAPSHEPITSDYFVSLIHPDDRPSMDAWIAACLGGEEAGSLEFRIVHPDGAVRYLNGRGELIRAAEGRAVHMAGTVQDVTERRKVEEALRESEARTQLLIQASNVGLWDWNLVTNEVFFSPEWKRQLGYADDELSNRLDEWERRLHPSDRANTLAAVTDFLEGRKAEYETEFRMQHRDGSWRWIFTRADIIRDPNGRPVRMMGCHLDITDQRRAAEELRQVFERITDAVVALDRNWVYTFVNQRAAELLGRPASDLIGKNMMTQFPEWKDQVEMAYRAAMESQQPARLEAYYPRLDRWFENHMYPSLEGLTIYFDDVTDRIKAQVALAASEERLRSMIQNQPECVKVVSAGGALLEMNPAGLAMLEADSIDQVAGSGFVRLIAPEYRAAFADLQRRVMLGGSGRLTFEVVGLRGSRLWLETHAAPLRDPQGRVTGLLGLTRDITARKAAEDELRSSRQELRALTARLNGVREEEAKRIARELHDELGQRLTALNMRLYQVEGRTAAGATASSDEWARIHSEVDHTIEVVQRIAGELRFGHLDILGLAGAIEWQVQEFQKLSGVRCTLTIPDEVTGLTDERATAVLRVCQEALTNVARHARATAVDVALLVSEGRVTLEVCDNGRGITIDEQTARDSLGLLGMRERARATGGVITIARQTGGGTLVRLTTAVPSAATGGV